MESGSLILGDEGLEEILAFTIQLARNAGKIILEGSSAIREGVVNEKVNAVDLVTEWDVKVEKYVREKIANKYPGFQFIGEESYSTRPPLTDLPTFCVDPIDGTTNFIHGFPFACISIGLIYMRVPFIGVIYNPFLDQLYSARKGHGAFLNLTTPLPLHAPSVLPSLSSALIGIEWGSDRSKDVMAKKSNSFVKLAGNPKEILGGKMAHGFRSMGSAALNYCQVASGSLDMYWEIGCWPWDVCAGIVIAQEAGAFVSGSSTSPHNGLITEDLLWGRNYIVVRGIAPTPTETSVEAQRRIIKEFYETVEEWQAK